MLHIFCKIKKQVTKLLLPLLGVMWLTFAIPPCALAAAFDNQSHHCCPQDHGNSGTNKHMHDEEICISCESVEPLKLSAYDFINLSNGSSISDQPVIYKDNYHLIAISLLIALKLHPHVDLKIQQPPPLRFRVLLI